jgi:cob(I)alamin adenosyltransferase
LRVKRAPGARTANFNLQLATTARRGHRRRMSIVTKTGDKGTTAFMYGRRVPKHHPRVEAYGTVDELNAALGMARASATHDFVRSNLLTIQQDLVTLMGELATAVEDLPRYVKDGYTLVTSAMTHKLDAVVKEIEAQSITFKGWATPGATLNAAALDVARTVCRRAERRVCALQEAEQLHNSEIIIYLNRLADLLWLMARWVETHSPA